ncbi:hypothetical protein SAMN05444007_108208 [Cribrihabitans marinus]|uniref:Uncharacterized protein n=1 Tax=Cribrihabitans marinus TaxID=1227549 RepID=A0A1H7CMA3_9RHOB|nr:hypothetical protein [Cribrihabitans marinus]GGH36050.1 hypothetical protein GCM10010973_29770 [Cribrihabitans marinus]SEJ90818.1 hypothetical protein SAMN05444007_108208 [Cribrihabitans marinus]
MHTLIGLGFAVFAVLLVLGGDLVIAASDDAEEPARPLLPLAAICGVSAFLLIVYMHYLTLA